MRWVYVGGTFDLFHAGHIRFLSQVNAVSDGAPIVVSLNRDEFAARYKRRPILSLSERMAVVEQCRLVDRVIVNVGDEDSWETILGFDGGVSLIAHGDDWVGVGLMEQMGITEDMLSIAGIRLLHVPYSEGISSREIEERVLARAGVSC